MYSPDDYDNTALSDDDDVKQRAESSVSPIIQLPIIHPGMYPGDQRASAPVKPRTTIKSSEEQSLDQLVAHLLGEVSPVSLPATTSGGPEPLSNSQAPLPLRWPQGDSLPRVEMRKPTAAVRKYDVPVSGASAKFVTKELTTDENDNVFKNVILDHQAVAPVDHQAVAPARLPHTPPLAMIYKKTTSSPDHVASSSSATTSELTAKPKVASTSDRSGKVDQSQELRPESSTSSNYNAENELHFDVTTTPQLRLDAEQLNHTERSHSETDRRRNEGKPDDGGLSMSSGAQQSSLLDQFKSLRLEVLTSTSQLLSCVSGTWKRGESFRSKLTTIMQLCLALRTSVNLLETFLQSALSTAADNSPLVETANNRIKNLQAVQTSIDAYIETLDGENLAGVAAADRSDLKVGGIIHLTKEIPGLVRTFAPVVEYLAATQPGLDVPDQSDGAFYTTELNQATISLQSNTPADLPHTPALAILELSYQHSSEATKQAQWERTNDVADTDVKLSPTNESSAVASSSPHSLTETEQRTIPVEITTISATDAKQSAVSQSLQTDNEQRSFSVISDRTPVQSTPIPSQTNVSDIGTKDITIDGADRTKSHSEHTGRKQPLLLFPANTETATPPTPPPKLRIASQYHASLGITNSLMSAPSPTVATTTTTGKYDGDVSAMRDVVVGLPAEERTEIVATSDKLGQKKLESDSGNTTTDINHLTGYEEDIVATEEKTLYRFPRATVTEASTVVLRRSPAAAARDVDDQRCRVSESELETPDFRASGVSQTMVDQLEALQRQANAQAVVVHTDTSAGFDSLGPRSPNPYYQSPLRPEDRRLLMFYCDQMTGHWNVLDHAASAFFHCMDRRQPPKVFVSHSKFVIVAGHKMAYVGDVLARNIEDSNARDWIVVHSNRLCDSLKTAVRATKEAALAYPTVPEQQLMVDCIKEVTDWAIELKEVVDRLAYIGRPDHVLA